MREKIIIYCNSVDEFLRISSINEAFIVRGAELILLSILVSANYLNFPDLNILILLSSGVLAATLGSFFIYKVLIKEKAVEKSSKERDQNN